MPSRLPRAEQEKEPLHCVSKPSRNWPRLIECQLALLMASVPSLSLLELSGAAFFLATATPARLSTAIQRATRSRSWRSRVAQAASAFRFLEDTSPRKTAAKMHG